MNDFKFKNPFTISPIVYYTLTHLSIFPILASLSFLR
jgi:hypothetical protein